MNIPQREKATNAQRKQIQTMFGIVAVNSEVNTKEETFPEEMFGERHSIFSNYSQKYFNCTL